MGNTLFILAVIVYFIVNWISFPSYNIAISLIALHTGAQEEIALVLKSSSICVIIGISSILADVAFCFLWAKEVDTTQ